MAHFAKLDDNNNVENVIVIANYNTNDKNGVEKEEIGIAFCKKLFGENSKWKKCSFTGAIRKNYPSCGWIYNEELDIFLPPKPYDSWHIDKSLGEWVAPIPPPKRIEFDAESSKPPKHHIWNEEKQEWYYSE